MTITRICSLAIVNTELALKQDAVPFDLCSKQGHKNGGFCPKQGIYFRNFLPYTGSGF